MLSNYLLNQWTNPLRAGTLANSYIYIYIYSSTLPVECYIWRMLRPFFFFFGTCPGFFQIMTSNFLGEKSKDWMFPTISFAQPTWASSNPAGHFLFCKSLLATKPGNYRAQLLVVLTMVPTASDTVALPCLCNSINVHQEGSSHCQRQVSRLMPPHTASQPITSTFGENFPHRGRTNGFNFSVTWRTSKRTVL